MFYSICCFDIFGECFYFPDLAPFFSSNRNCKYRKVVKAWLNHATLRLVSSIEKNYSIV